MAASSRTGAPFRRPADAGDGVIAPGQEESPYPLALHFDLTEASPLGERYLRWTPRTLFRYLGNRRHRRHQLLQDLGARIPLDLVLPAGTPSSDGVLLEGRKCELERLATGASWQLILGPRGIGKTSLLERAARERERAGWTRLELRVLESDPSAAAERLGFALALWHRTSQPPPETQLPQRTGSPVCSPSASWSPWTMRIFYQDGLAVTLCSSC